MDKLKKFFSFEKVPWSGKAFLLSFSWLALLMFVLDIATKWAVELNLDPGDKVTVIDNFFYITLSYNQGAVFGMGNGTAWARGIFIAISWIMSFVILYYYLKNLHRMKGWLNASLMLLFAGAVGNLIDRTFYWGQGGGPSGVIDFLQFYLGGGPGAASGPFNPFATFNVADSCVTVGVVMLLVVLIVESARSEHGSKATAEEKKALGEDAPEKKMEEASNPSEDGKKDS